MTVHDGIARPPVHFGPRAADAPAALTALQVARAYGFPDATGADQTIAIIELGGGFTQADLDQYFAGLGMIGPVVQAVSVQGAGNDPGQDADAEVLLDIQVAGAVAPGARQLVYFAPNTDDGFLAAVEAAANAEPAPCAISISWGAPESAWSASAMQAMNAAFAAARARGIVVLCAAGDSGADDGTSRKVADFPASSPNVIACGGTRLEVTTAGAWASESVWDDGASSASGGGYSATFPRPSWQPSAVVGPWRGLPDICGNADPESGYLVVIDGQQQVIGGTSAVAPLLAGMVARLAQLSGGPVGDLAPVAYANPDAFTDITSGGNEGYQAGVGWDPASGLGSPVGSKLLAALTSGPAPMPPPGPAPTPPPEPPPIVADAVDAAMWAAVRGWAHRPHACDNRAAAKAVRAWATAKGLA